MGHLADHCRPSSASLVFYSRLLVASQHRSVGWPSRTGTRSVRGAGGLPCRTARQLLRRSLGGHRATRSLRKSRGGHRAPQALARALGGKATQSLTRALGGRATTQSLSRALGARATQSLRRTLGGVLLLSHICGGGKAAIWSLMNLMKRVKRESGSR